MRFLALLALVGCADVVDYDEAQDADEADGKFDAPQSCANIRCGNPDAPNILFPGNPACSGRGCERMLASDDVFIPPRNGKPFGDTYLLGSESPRVLAGYSSGRIALLRRLALVGDGEHAVMIDPSWPDGARNFTGEGPRRGEDIVHEWLEADPARTFLIIYSRRSVGWDNYVGLQRTNVGDRVRACEVDVPHLLVPRLAGLAEAFVEPDSWNNGHCR